ncbi:hypothetical protein BaRGS_00034724 [Batillaria attramentaria]|uniref:Transmembrane protein n=1 Tax=Batillaria attramentaria TaxID=370345 RepID=A0ABD0JGU3_9CAEN
MRGFVSRVSDAGRSSLAFVRTIHMPRLHSTLPSAAPTRNRHRTGFFAALCECLHLTSMNDTADSAIWENLIGKSVAEDISFRISERKRLLRRRRILVDVAFGMSFLGLGFMMTETELYLQNHITKTSMESITLLTLVSLSTLLLMSVILGYQITVFQQQLVDIGIDDIRLLVTFRSLLPVSVELIVCAVHPPPCIINDDHLYAALCVLMFCRLYLIVRVFLVHSNLVKDTATRSLGVLNKV